MYPPCTRLVLGVRPAPFPAKKHGRQHAGRPNTFAAPTNGAHLQTFAGMYWAEKTRRTHQSEQAEFLAQPIALEVLPEIGWGRSELDTGPSGDGHRVHLAGIHRDEQAAHLAMLITLVALPKIDMGRPRHDSGRSEDGLVTPEIGNSKHVRVFLLAQTDRKQSPARQHGNRASVVTGTQLNTRHIIPVPLLPVGTLLVVRVVGRGSAARSVLGIVFHGRGTRRLPGGRWGLVRRRRRIEDRGCPRTKRFRGESGDGWWWAHKFLRSIHCAT